MERKALGSDAGRVGPEPGEFGRLRRAFPRINEAAPRPDEAREAYKTLARALEPNHPALVSVRTALGRRYPAERPRPRNPNVGPPIHFVPPPPPMAPEDASAMSGFIGQGLAAMTFPPVGAAWSIVQIDNGVPKEVAYDKRGTMSFVKRDRGAAHFEAIPFTNDTTMNCFSVSKTVTAVAVMKAIEMYVASLTTLGLMPTDPEVLAASILASPLIGGPHGDLIMRGWLGDASDTGVVNPQAQVAASQVTVADLLAHTAGLSRGIIPGTSDWTQPGKSPGEDVAHAIRFEIGRIDPSKIGSALYSNTGYWLLRGVVASIAWLAEGTTVSHGDETDRWTQSLAGVEIPGLLRTREEQAGTKYNSFVREHVFGHCFDRYGKHFELPHLKTTDDQSSFMPAKPRISHDKLRWVPSFDPAIDAPVWALGGESDWVFSARSCAWFIACVEAGMVIEVAHWDWLKDPSSVPLAPGPRRHEAYSAKNPWGLKVTSAPSPPAAAPLPNGIIYYKRGDGGWNRGDLPCRRVTDASALVDRGNPGAQGFGIGCHAEWVLVGRTMISVVVNSATDPLKMGDDSDPATSLHGVLLGVLNDHKWRGL